MAANPPARSASHALNRAGAVLKFAELPHSPKIASPDWHEIRPVAVHFPSSLLRSSAPSLSLMEPLQALSRFLYLCVLVGAPVAWVLVVFLKRRWGHSYDGAVEASSEEILEELEMLLRALCR